MLNGSKRLLALADNGNHDRGPLDLVGLAAGQPPVRVEQHFEMRPGIDLMKTAPVLGHCLLHPRLLHCAPPFPNFIATTPKPGPLRTHRHCNA